MRVWEIGLQTERRLSLGLISGGKQLAYIPQDNGADQHTLGRVVDLGVQAALDRVPGADL